MGVDHISPSTAVGMSFMSKLHSRSRERGGWAVVFDEWFRSWQNVIQSSAPRVLVDLDGGYCRTVLQESMSHSVRVDGTVLFLDDSWSKIPIVGFTRKVIVIIANSIFKVLSLAIIFSPLRLHCCSGLFHRVWIHSIYYRRCMR